MQEQAARYRWVYGLNELEAAKCQFADAEKLPRNLLGGKGFGLAEMTALGLPVPPGFVITTEACKRFFDNGGSLDGELWGQVEEALKKLEAETGSQLGNPQKPLLVSCRSGARISMPGMMDTVLNIGLNQEVIEGLSRESENARFVYDLYRRLIQMFAGVVMGVPDDSFEDLLTHKRKAIGVATDAQLSTEDWQDICSQFETLYEQETAEKFPQDPVEQIRLAIEAVFKSWNGKRAFDYRKASGIPHDWGTAVNIIAMVFGNRDKNSATGVCFTRNPDTGEKALYGDFLINAQGEDVVAGIRNTLPIAQLEDPFPKVYQEFKHYCDLLENHYKDMQDVEFTIEQGKLWMLQTRSGKRTARAAIKIAVDLTREGIITRREAILRVTPDQVDTILHPSFHEPAKAKAVNEGRLIAKGINASPGAAVGIVVFDADTAEILGQEGKAVIMVRPFTKPDDIHGMLASKGILTAEGGATSHAAVVARQFGVPCVVGANSLRIDLKKNTFTVNGICIREGDTLSIDGGTGECFMGDIPTLQTDMEHQEDLNQLLLWADAEKKLKVRANADYPEDARKAIKLGAEGIGLCRTEHMFFHADRLPTVQTMILTQDESIKDQCLETLLQYQKNDFVGLFEAMEGRPIIIRLIDPPLHEFIPEKDSVLLEVHDLKKSNNPQKLAEKEALLGTLESMHESNPMMGLRGVRLSIVFPKIVSMQVRAIFEAACEVASQGIPVQPEVMIPLVSHINELKEIQPRLMAVASQVMQETGIPVSYLFGTMIELPRACVTADTIACVAEFFSFGTNDLTQMTYGFSRDDAEGGFLIQYINRGILESNPFKTLDREGVGSLIRQAVSLGRKTNPHLSIGVCGEHGGDPESIRFFHEAGLDYVSCSPLRIPVARLAAAQANLKVP